ncbi:MAG TPA: hypothetical protein VEG38_00035 [Acidimicrobiia bacterium]|nr:hypothetical protein [Acidimicrobiia bacterium]
MTDDRPGDAGGESVAEVGGDGTPEPLPDDVARAALRGDPDAEAAVEEGWEQARSMEGEAPSG